MTFTRFRESNYRYTQERIKMIKKVTRMQKLHLKLTLERTRKLKLNYLTSLDLGEIITRMTY